MDTTSENKWNVPVLYLVCQLEKSKNILEPHILRKKKAWMKNPLETIKPCQTIVLFGNGYTL